MLTDLIEDRSDDSYVLEIQDITLTPSSPEPGKELRWEMTGRLKEQVDLTQVQCQVQVKLGLVTLLRKTAMLPEVLKMLGAELEGATRPPAGKWKQTWTFTLPREVPMGDVRIYLQSYTGGGEEKDFMDLNLRIDFRRR
ncbi:ML domain-containing protein [Kitasatospora sp. NPDC087271]|uniref:ML domain-containing protein n=1 Tax=Kitasatospora sp. NPDC087271 TaxID=3364067 RepID=UPI0037FEF6FD